MERQVGMTDPAARAHAIAERGRARIDTNIAREWWRVHVGGDEWREVYFCPPQSAQEVMTRWYPGSGVVAK